MGVHVQLVGHKVEMMVEGYETPIPPRYIGCALGAFVCFLLSLPPSLKVHSNLAFGAVLFTITGIVMGMACAGIARGKLDAIPDAYDDGPPRFGSGPKPGATFWDVLVAFQNIAFAFVGQGTFPSFIAEMKEPQCVSPLFPWRSNNC